MRLEEIIANYLPDEKELSDMTTFFSVFSDCTRLRIISLLTISELCVTDIGRLLKINQTTVSHQLAILRKAGIADFRREGKTMRYFINNENVENIMEVGVRHKEAQG